MKIRLLTSYWLSGVAIACMIAAIFVVDLFTDWAIAVAVLYVVPILLSLRLLSRRRLVWLAAGCVMLTGLGSILARFSSAQAGVINIAISVTAIVTTTYLGSRMLSLEAASHEARAQLLRLSRIGNLGELTASIAHEVNQPLAALSSSAGACRRWLTAGPPEIGKAIESLERVIGEAARAAGVIAGVRRLATRTPPSRELTNLAVLVGECLAIARSTFEEQQIGLFVDIDDALPRIPVDRVQIQQIVINLLLNAIESLAQHARSEQEIRILGKREGNFLTIEIADNGPGLSREDEQHLWEPFWTGKEGGTGLGLTIGRAIAETHGGSLRFMPRRGGGAVFELRLPMGEGA